MTMPLDTPPLDTPTPEPAYSCAGCSYDEPGGFHDPRNLRWGQGLDHHGARIAKANWFCVDCQAEPSFKPLGPTLAAHLERLNRAWRTEFADFVDAGVRRVTAEAFSELRTPDLQLTEGG